MKEQDSENNRKINDSLSAEHSEARMNGEQGPLHDGGKDFAAEFQMEIECWCYGFVMFGGDMTNELAFRVIHEMRSVFQNAITSHYAFDLLDTALRMSRATGSTVTPKEVAVAILVNLPAPFEVSQESRQILLKIIDQAEREYGDVLGPLEEFWRKEYSKSK